MTIKGYHFSLLNHIHHREWINVPFYLLSSLMSYISKGDSLPLYQDLIYAL